MKKRRAPIVVAVPLPRVSRCCCRCRRRRCVRFPPVADEQSMNGGPSGRCAPERPREGFTSNPTEIEARSFIPNSDENESTQPPAFLPYLEQVLPLNGVVAGRLMARWIQLGAKI